MLNGERQPMFCTQVQMSFQLRLLHNVTECLQNQGKLFFLRIPGKLTKFERIRENIPLTSRFPNMLKN